MDFGEILNTAWKIVWKHKVLWIFGILAGCARGGTGTGTGWRNNFRPDLNPSPEAQQYFVQFSEWLANHVGLVVALGVLFVVLVIIGIFLAGIGRIALIRGTFRADAGAERLGLGELFHESQPFFWRVLGLSIAVGLAFLIVLAPIMLIGALTSGMGFLFLLPLSCLFIPLTLAARVVVQQADAAIVIENLGIVDGVRRAWGVARNNVGPLLVIWLITVVIALVVTIVIALPLLAIAIPAGIAFGASAFSAGNANLSFTPLLIGGACIVVYLPILLLANGILTAYLESVWALTFLRLTKKMKEQPTPAAPPSNA